ncbi:Glycosyltransferase involved in cell wall bisynthesis [Paenibacillus sp. UNC496MF]|uniref:glycosyltransferase family 4 protein n=1 Tax=Paenibacillus sp. UNC496MF TaxID=1502753 RepID=UPI0008E362A9|nr:glycosyltransferase family 4 protein [Paenibacillus sp. UNC496MF]SFI28257.1 Glycosyltransferase involved in cell wall bisynthesis [Paenibacillus sp. UNC496MF]
MGNPTVYMWPKHSPDNKYSELLTRSIERNGLTVEHYDQKAAFKPRRGDIVHMHWPSNSYTASAFPLTMVKSVFFALLLLFYRARGIRLFWTVHNVWPHSGKTRWDRVMRKFILSVCQKGFVLSEAVKTEVAETFGVSPGKLVVTPHGHYVDAYASKGTDIRKRFGIAPDTYLYLFIGRINPYKGVDKLVDAFAALGEANSQLLIAGKVDKGYSLDFIDRVNDGRIHVYPQFVDDHELADYLAAANVIVLPYKQISTSGSAILALSYKKPVIAPRLGALGEYVSDGCGILYDPDDPDGLRQALRASMAMDAKETELHIAAKLRELDWGRIAGKMIQVYTGTKRYEVNA